jgi:hypothetical protein
MNPGLRPPETLCHQRFAENVTSDGEHFLHGLAGHPELAGDLGL